MPSDTTDTVDDAATVDSAVDTAIPADVRNAARGYWRRTLAFRVLVGFGYFVVSVAILLTLPYLPALAIIVVFLGTLAAPVFKSGGRIELTTDRDADAVRDDFTDGLPPVLGFQAALADDIRATETGVAYDLSSIFGLRSATMTVETKQFAASDADSDPNTTDSNADLEIVVTVGDKPWGRYRVTTTERDGATAVTITMVPDRRFGVRRLPDFLFGRRYRSRLFDGQGYSLVADNTSLAV